MAEDYPDGQIALPASVRKELGIEEGDLVEIEVVDERAVRTTKAIRRDSRPNFEGISAAWVPVPPVTSQSQPWQLLFQVSQNIG